MLIESTDTPLPGSGPGTALPTTIDKAEISKDYDMFLRLMTAQLKNQDPLQPLDGTEFVAQLAQFSGVEQQIKTNERLDALLGALTRSAAEVSLGFLGRTVETASGKIGAAPRPGGGGGGGGAGLEGSGTPACPGAFTGRGPLANGGGKKVRGEV